MPKDPPKCMKRKEIEGQAILISEPLTMESQTKHKGKRYKLNPNKSKTNTKGKGEKIKKLP